MTIDEMHEKFYPLFEVYEGEETERSYYKKGEILRGIETPVAWNWIVEKLLESFEWIRTHNHYIPNPNFNGNIPPNKGNPRYIPGPFHDIKIFQIKEKFGSFECYYTYNGDGFLKGQIERAIGRAEALAAQCCAICGQLGDNGKPLTKQTKGWINKVCTKCKLSLEDSYVNNI